MILKAARSPKIKSGLSAPTVARPTLMVSLKRHRVKISLPGLTANFLDVFEFKDGALTCYDHVARKEGSHTADASQPHETA